ncbi:LPS-assembly protein LptD [Luminiphilus sp.]|nr:LPS-assembly protein LptD [Luminiphilus sp.]
MPLPAQQLINHQSSQARCGFSRVALFAAVAVASQVAQAEEPPAAAQQMVLFSEDIAAQLDWQPLPLLTQAERDLRCRQCDGQFVDPLKGQSPTAPGSADLEVSADNSSSTEGQLSLTGNVSVIQGNRSIQADSVAFDRDRQFTEASGNVAYREPGVVLQGEHLTFDSERQHATVNQAHFALHEPQLSGAAQQLERDASGEITIEDGAVTFCAPENPQWYIKTETLKIEPDEGMATATHATLRWSGVPIFYVPWMTFPVDDRRKTGLLFPSIGSDTRGGLDVTTPIYFNLAPNYDATYSPRYIGERGLLHQANGRWLSQYAGAWDVTGQYISDDDKYSEDFPEGDSERWAIGVKHRGNYGESWRTTIKYNKVSDPDYVRDLDNSTLSSQRQTALKQLGQIDYLGEDWKVSLQAQQFQSLADDITNNYKKLPQLTARWRGDANLAGLQPIALLQYSNFDTDANKVRGERIYGEAGVTYPLNWTWGFLRTTAKYRSVAYDLENLRSLPEAKPDASSGVFSVDGGLIFERATTFGGQSASQTLEPRVYYLYSEYDEQRGQPDFDSAELTFSYTQLFRDTRFSGHDRLDDANQISVGVTTRFFADSDGRERLNASIGQIFYFRDREVRLKARSPVLDESLSATAVEFNWFPNETWSIRSSMLYDTEDNEFDALSAQVGYRPITGQIFNVGYTLREPPPSQSKRPVTEQANFSAYYPIGDNWGAFAAVEYSLEGNEFVEDMVGVEYDNCCWKMRLLYMRYLDTAGSFAPDFSDPDLERENAVQFQFVLKGMGGFGSRVENLMRDMIRGFDPTAPRV